MASGDWIGGNVISASWVYAPINAEMTEAANQRVAGWTAPTRCRLLDIGDTTLTSSFSGSIFSFAAIGETTDTLTIMLRNLSANTTGVDMFTTGLTLRLVTDDSAESVMDAINVTTESSLIVEQGETLVLDIDTAHSATSSLMFNAYFQVI